MLRFAFKPRHPVTKVAFTADGRELVTAQPFTGIAVRNRLTGEARLTIAMERVATIYAMAVHPKFGWIGVHTNRGLGVFDQVKGHELTPGMVNSITGLRPQVISLLMTWWLVREGDERVTLELPDRGNPIVTLNGNGATTLTRSRLRNHALLTGRYVITFATDGSKLALGDGEQLTVFDLSSLGTPQIGGGKRSVLHPLFTLERPDPTAHGTFADKQAEHWLPPVAFDHAGRTMFTLGLRNRVQRIDLATGGVIAEWGWRCEPIRSLAVAPDDLTAAGGCQRGEVVLWDLE